MHDSKWIGRFEAELDAPARYVPASRLRRGLLGLLALAWLVPVAEAAPLRLVDRAAGLGITHVPTCGDPRGETLVESSGAGAALFDADQDGDLDLLLLDGSTLERIHRGDAEPDRLYRNDAARFVDVTDTAGLDTRGWSQGAQVGDVDQDGDLDLYVTRFGPDVLYRNDGDGTFTDVTAAVGIDAPGWSTAAAFGDVDHDGDLDLYVARYLELDPSDPPRPDCTWRGLPAPCGPDDLRALPDLLFLNDGTGTFAAADSSGIGDAGAAASVDVRLADLDDDGDLDVLVAHDGDLNQCYWNDGGGRFTPAGLASALAVDERGRPFGSSALALCDWSDDGDIDVYVTGDGDEPDLLLENLGGGLLHLGHAAALHAFSTRGARSVDVAFIDFDNDGRHDLLAVRGERFPLANAGGTGTRLAQSERLFEQRDGRLVPLAESGTQLDQPAPSRAVAVGDLDDDGDLDLVVTRLREAPLVLINRHESTVDARSSAQIRLEGAGAHGARISAVVGDRRLTRIAATAGGRSQSDRRIHLGLGWEDAADSVRVHWSNGEIELIGSVAAESEVTVRQGEGIVAERWLSDGMR